MTSAPATPAMSPEPIAPDRRLIVRIVGFGVDAERDARTIDAAKNGIVTCATCAIADLAEGDAWAILLNDAPAFRLGVQIGATDDPKLAIEHFRTTVGRAPDHVLAADGSLISPPLPDTTPRHTEVFGSPHAALGDLLLLLTLIPAGLSEIVCNPPIDASAPDWAALGHKAARELIASEHIRLITYHDLEGSP